MFNSTVLDMVVLLFFTYFISSVLVSSLNEMVATLFKIRANQLEDTLKNLLFDSTWAKYVEEHIFASPYFQSLKRTADSKSPSYMPAENFAKAIMDSLRAGNNVLNISSIKVTLEANSTGLPPELQKVLLGYVDTAEDDIEKFQHQIEGFYNKAMDRASGWYKRKLKPISFFVALGLVVILNIDTVRIINKSIQNPTQLKAQADSIAMLVPRINYQQKGDTIIFQVKSVKGDTIINKAYSTKNPDSTVTALKQEYKDFGKTDSLLNANVFNLGYKNWDDVWFQWFHTEKGKKTEPGDFIGFLLLKLIGVLITVAALQVGSTYWFDALNKVVNLRGTGPKPAGASSAGNAPKAP